MHTCYELKDWVRDMAAAAKQSAEVPREQWPTAIRDYFLSHYHTPAEAKWHADRIGLAMAYLEEHSRSFEASGYALASSKGGVASRYLVLALGRFFGLADEITHPPEPQVFIDAAKEEERDWTES